MMNDPMVLEASRVLSERLMVEDSDVRSKIVKAFRLIVCRKPAEKELLLLERSYATELEKLSPTAAEELLQAGEYPRTVRSDAVKLAALMVVINTIYNLEETITKT